MKFDDRRIVEVVRRLAAFRVVLLHGDDPVLITERARLLARAVQDGRQGLFPPTELDGGDHARAVDALEAPLLGGGVRLVRLRDATDSATASVEAVFDRPAQGQGLLLVEAAALPARSRLRALVERSECGAAILCRGGDARDMSAAIDQIFAAHAVRIEPAVRSVLLERARARADGYGAALQEAEKLALFAATSGVIEEADVAELDQTAPGGALDELAAAAACGRARDADVRLEALLDDGAAPASVLRGLLSHLGRLRDARLAVECGADVEAAIAGLRPPVFFRRVPEMREAISLWRGDELEAACARIWRADLACRETTAPAVAICRRTVRDVAARPGASRARRASRPEAAPSD